MVDPSSISALGPLFAPYCGGVGRERLLLAAIEILDKGRLQGIRALNDGGGHHYELSWSGVHAPMESLSCQLRFPDFPAVVYDFPLPCHQLVSWLIESAGQGLPESFWPWLLQGRPSGPPT